MLEHLIPKYIFWGLSWGSWLVIIAVFCLALDEGMWAAYRSTKGFRRVVATFMLLFVTFAILSFGMLIWLTTFGGY